MEKETIIEYEESACACDRCQSMCKSYPCWPLPEEAAKLIEAGYGNKLMLDYWSRSSDEGGDIYVLCPASEGNEGKHAPWMKRGACNLLTEENLCPLHDKGLKPFEGRVSAHDKRYQKPAHEYVAEQWDNPEAQKIATDWAKEQGLYTEYES